MQSQEFPFLLDAFSFLSPTLLTACQQGIIPPFFFFTPPSLPSIFPNHLFRE